MPPLAFFLLVLLLQVAAVDGAVVLPGLNTSTCPFLPTGYPPTATDLPTCGDGVLDPGEVCDDGNRVGGDGCNAWCSQFDLLTRTCTLAGQPSGCGSSRFQAGRPAPPSSITFCDLTTLAVSPDGQYVFVADDGAIFSMRLADPSSTPLARLPATSAATYTRFCTLVVFPTGPNETAPSVLAHECASQTVLLFPAQGSYAQVMASLPLIAPVTSDGTLCSGYYDAAAAELILVGLPSSTLRAADRNTCAVLYAVPASPGWPLPSPPQVIADIPCVAYNVWEGGLIYTSFSLDGMVPHAVTAQPCLAHMSASWCYVVSMRRADMQQLRVFVPSSGGLDLGFQVSTDATVNVLGSPLRAYCASNTYTLTASCLTAQKAFAAPSGKVPPPVTLGQACSRVPAQGWPCATPFNNPFSTDVLTSPYLLPGGLSIRHTHADLVTIFQTQPPNNIQPGTVLAGMPLYAQVLSNVFGDTIPIAIAEVPSTLDLVYITRTTIGLISTKGVLLYDAHNPGYCLATDMIQCPAGTFGSVGSACVPCPSSSASPSSPSIAQQVQCLGQQTSGRRRLLGQGQSQGASTFTSVVSSTVERGHLDSLISYFLLLKGHACLPADGSTLTQHQPFNILADATLGGDPASATSGQLIPTLVQAAQQNTGRPLAKTSPDEYSVQWSAQDLSMLAAQSAENAPYPLNDTYIASACEAASLSAVAGINGSIDGLHSALFESCSRYTTLPFLQYWMPCALHALYTWNLPSSLVPAGNHSASTRRRLLQQASSAAGAAALFVPVNGPTFVSNTAVVYNSGSSGPPPPPPAPSTTPAPSSSSTGLSGTTIIIIGVAGGVVGTVAIVGISWFAIAHSQAAAAHAAATKLL